MALEWACRKLVRPPQGRITPVAEIWQGSRQWLRARLRLRQCRSTIQVCAACSCYRAINAMRVIYYFAAPDAVYFIAVYAKNQKENLSDAEKQALAEILRPIKRQAH